MQLKFLLAQLFFANYIVAQNLIPNPGFEDYISCPEFPSQIELAIPWGNASNGTPDFFHACSHDDQVMVPFAGFHFLSYQPARSGEGMGHICVYTSTNNPVSEYMQTKLSSGLLANTAYYIEFFVSPDFNPDPNDNGGYTDAIGLGFTNAPYYEEIATGEAISIKPVIEHFGQLITDTIGWTRISGCYTASGGESNAIIGNFRNKSETIVELENPNVWPYSNYFYIEDVLVEAFDPLPDTLIKCNDTQKELNAAFYDAVYQWNTGETNPVIQIQDEGMYSVEALIGGCVLTDTVWVIDGEMPGYFPEDTSGCLGSTIMLYAPLPGVYTWSDASHASSISIHDPGIYDITIVNECGQYEFSTDVTLKECDCDIYIPNIFSPNHDGINDQIEASVNCDFEYQILAFQIFDRWGSIIYSSGPGALILWDGQLNGSEVQTGNYVWQLTYQFVMHGLTEKRNVSGDFTLIR